MDLNFNVNSVDFSLKTMCAVKINCEILMPIRERAVHWKFSPEIIRKAKQKISKLQLPTSLKNRLKNLIPTVNEELDRWQLHIYWVNRAKLIWTPQGTVNIIKCAKSILKDNSVNVHIRFQMACTYCLDKYIFQIWQELNVDTPAAGRQLMMLFYDNSHPNIMLRFGMFVNIWIAAFIGMYSIESVYNRCFEIAILWDRDFEARCYSAKATPEGMYSLIQDKMLYYTLFLPCTLCCIFARLEDANQQVMRNNFELAIIRKLLYWPYQPLFLKAVDPNFIKYEAGIYISVICRKIQSGCKLYDYCEILEKVWKLAALSLRQLPDPKQFQCAPDEFVITETRIMKALMAYRHDAPRPINEFLICSQTWMIFIFLVKQDAFALFEKLLLEQCAHITSSMAIWKQFKCSFLHYILYHDEYRVQLGVTEQKKVVEIIDRIIEKQEEKV